MSTGNLRFRARRALGDSREQARRTWLKTPPVRKRLKYQAVQAWNRGTIAFVCHGNICRSPFAERLLAEGPRGSGRVLSAGYFPEPDRRSPELAVEVAARLGVDLRSHRSRVLDAELVDEADTIFVFDQENYRTIRREYPSARPNLHFIGALNEDGPLFIPDPYGGGAEDYEVVYRRIIDLIAQGRASGGQPRP